MRRLDFDPIYNDSLDSSGKQLVAVMLPKPYFDRKDHAFIDSITGIIESMKWKCKTISWREDATYISKWCKSDPQTIILGPHVLIEVEYDECIVNNPSYTDTLNKSNSWIILETDYDSLLNSNNVVRYYTYSYEAAFPADVEACIKRMHETALKYVR